MSDEQVARVARNLVEALRDFAYQRKDEDKKKISALQTELCGLVRQEERDKQTPETK